VQALGGEGPGDRGHMRGWRGTEGVAVGEIWWAALGELRRQDIDTKEIRGIICSRALCLT